MLHEINVWESSRAWYRRGRILLARMHVIRACVVQDPGHGFLPPLQRLPGGVLFPGGDSGGRPAVLPGGDSRCRPHLPLGRVLAQLHAHEGQLEDVLQESLLHVAVVSAAAP